MNVNMDMGGVGYKEPQSRLKKWTAMDMSVNSPLDQNSKPGQSKELFICKCICVLGIVCDARLSPSPGAMSSGLRLEDSPFGPYDFLSTGPSPLSPPGQSMGSVGDGWPPRAKSPHGNTNVTWPPGTHTHTLSSVPH